MRVWVLALVDIDMYDIVGVFSSYEKAEEVRNGILKNHRQFSGQPEMAIYELDKVDDYTQKVIKG